MTLPIYTCRAKVDQNPSTPKQWRDQATAHLGLSEPDKIKLCTLQSWRLGTNKDRPSGSKLGFEHFLHFRALVVQHEPREFDMMDHVNQECAKAAWDLTQPKFGSWPELDHYLEAVEDSNPDIGVEGLGLFAAAKVSQNHTLIEAYRSGIEAATVSTMFDSGDDGEPTETPIKRPGPRIGPNYYFTAPSGANASDEMIVNQAIIEFSNALTRPWMVGENVGGRPGTGSPSRGGAKESPGVPRTLARWTIERNKFQIKERVRPGDAVQAAVVDSNKVLKKQVSPKYVPLLETQTDGHLYDTDGREVLAIVEAKSRRREKDPLRIEWQETAEILAWLNLRLRTERADTEARGGRGSRHRRRGLLRAPQGKYRYVITP